MFPFFKIEQLNLVHEMAFTFRMKYLKCQTDISASMNACQITSFNPSIDFWRQFTAWMIKSEMLFSVRFRLQK